MTNQRHEHFRNYLIGESQTFERILQAELDHITIEDDCACIILNRKDSQDQYKIYFTVCSYNIMDDYPNHVTKRTVHYEGGIKNCSTMGGFVQ